MLIWVHVGNTGIVVHDFFFARGAVVFLAIVSARSRQADPGIPLGSPSWPAIWRLVVTRPGAWGRGDPMEPNKTSVGVRWHWSIAAGRAGEGRQKATSKDAGCGDCGRGEMVAPPDWPSMAELAARRCWI